ncbi:MAG: hypothetical protein HYV14_10445 [Elusimicrobia bacterium]|nr:hypothetical protein [Elusimicrobiota bacterium]
MPVLPRPSIAVQTPLPSSLSVSIKPSAAKADDVRREAAKSVAEWKSSRQAAPASAPAETPSLELDALFDGSFPASREVLSRAAARGVDAAALAQALSLSQSPSDAAARLSSLGVLGSKESSLAVSQEAEFRFLLTRLWRKTSSSLPSPFAVDKTFSVPALTVERDGTVFFVHGVAHGKYGAPRRGAVLSTVRRALAAGHAVYSEQNLPAYYGYKAGLETLDHASASGAPAKVVPAAPGLTRAALLLKRAIDWAVAPGSTLAALAWVIVSPASPFAWILLPLSGGLAWLILSGGLPLMAWKRRMLAAGARAEGLEDIADQYADEARHFFVAKPDLEVLRGLELPQPLGASEDAFSVRSRAIADAAAAHAAATGAKTAHVVVGHLHAHEVAARLAAGPRAPAPGSQIS